MMAPAIAPCPVHADGEHRTGSVHGLAAWQIAARLGFPANREDDHGTAARAFGGIVVKHSWGFQVDGAFCAVWDYLGSDLCNVFSTFGPHDKLRAVFGANYRGISQ